jgi:hypothetical protein
MDILEWRHLATMGRDHYVRVVYKGYLFPTGHAATLVKITERKFQAVPSGSLAGHNAAYLRQRFYIVVRQPTKTYPAHSSQPYDGRQWPFENVRITTLIPPILDNPSDPANDRVVKGQKAFWPRVGGQDFLFNLVATDTDGQKTEFSCPLAFISSTSSKQMTSHPSLSLLLRPTRPQPKSVPPGAAHARAKSSLCGQQQN